MSSTSPSFGSNNPFRRKTGGPSPSSAIPSGSHAPSSSLASPTLSSHAPRPPPVTSFRTAEPEHQDRYDVPIQTKPKKIVKRVRVQSPPPSSPEDSVPVTTYFPPADYDDDDDDDDDDNDDDEYDDDDRKNSRSSIDQGDAVDPFNGGQTDEESRIETSDEPTLPRAPPNPFSRTLGDLEHTIPGDDANSASGTKGALDVNSFKRLLLTGNADNPGAAGVAGSAAIPAATSTWSGSSPLPIPSHDGASITDASSVSRQPILDAIQDTPRTSHDISEPEEAGERRSVQLSSPLANTQPTPGRKKPPPPSSRHGKLIKIELGSDQRPGTSSKDSGSGVSLSTDFQYTSQQSPLSSTSDVNKPLPLPPTRTPADEQAESPFDREAAGKLPEAFSEAAAAPTNFGPSSSPGGTRSRSESQVSTGTTSSVRKPVAPPPRRHGRTDSKPPSIIANPADEEAQRSSMESTRSRPDSLRINSNTNAYAPAPPPPRRPSHARSGSSITSPISVSSPGSIDGSRLTPGTGFSVLEPPNHGYSMATVTTTKDGVPKLSPPPPPPARQSSARRPPSISSLESGSRRVSRGEKDGVIVAPPPPPRRSRNSKSNIETTEAMRSASGGIGRVEGEPPKSLATSEATSIGTGVDILKDLEALQNEVNAAMGKS